MAAAVELSRRLVAAGVIRAGHPPVMRRCGGCGRVYCVCPRRRVVALSVAVRRVMPLDGTGARQLAPQLRRPAGYVAAAGVGAATAALPSLVLLLEGWLR